MLRIILDTISAAPVTCLDARPDQVYFCCLYFLSPTAAAAEGGLSVRKHQDAPSFSIRSIPFVTNL